MGSLRHLNARVRWSERWQYRAVRRLLAVTSGDAASALVVVAALGLLGVLLLR
jgi:hypothetical protein